MRLITDEQAKQAAEAIDNWIKKVVLNHGVVPTAVYEALTTLQALPTVEVVAWMVTYEHGGGRQEHVLSLTEPPKPRFAALTWVTPLYATKEPL